MVSRFMTVVLLLLTAVSAAGCGDDTHDGSGSPDADAQRDGGASGGGGADPAATDAAADDPGGGDIGADSGSSCAPSAQEHEHDSSAPMHVDSPLPASAYNSSPPSSGRHCHQWGAYAVFDASSPLPACNFLHNLEHGAVVLLYNCPQGCPEIVSALEQVIEEAPDDPDCGADKRLILTPYTDMEATVAASAWGFTFTADCLDSGAREGLLEFIAAHWGSHGDAPEAAVCGGGAIAP